MKCKHCGGAIFIDDEYSTDESLLLVCVNCSKNWELSITNPLAKYLLSRKKING